MKKIFIFLIIILILSFRFSLSTNKIEYKQNGIYKILLEVEESRIKIFKINDKYPLEKIYGRLYYKEDGKYEGYYLISQLKKNENFNFVELEEIKSEKIKYNFMESYLNKIFDRSQENFSLNIKNMNKAFLMGNNNSISRRMKEKIIYLGLSHIFAMSGLHIGIVFMIFYFICFRICKTKFYIEISTLILLSLYYIGVKNSPSFTRAYIMIIIYLLAKILYEKVNVEKALYASMILSILFEPNTIFSLSFQLSYMAMISIIYFYPIVKKINLKNWKILNYVLFVLSIQIFLIPIQVYYFHNIPFLSMLANIIILPIASVYIALNYILLFLENFYLGFLLEFLVKLVYKIFEKFIDVFSTIPYNSIENYNDKLIYIYVIFLIYILIRKIEVIKWSRIYEYSKKRM